MITRESILKAFGNIKDEYIIEEYKKEEKSFNKRKNNVRKYNFEGINVMKGNGVRTLSVVAIAILAVVIAIVGINMNNKGGSTSSFTELVEIANPITEVNSKEEMKKYLGYYIPVLNKEVERYAVIGEGKYADHARVTYKDGTELNMEKGTGDVSGINGATFVKEEKLSNVDVKFYNYEFEDIEINYVIWEVNGFTFAYSNENGEISSTEITELIKLVK